MRRGCLWLGALALAGALACGGLWLNLGNLLVYTTALAPADAAVALGGDAGDFPRTREAVRLVQSGTARAFVFSPGAEDAGLPGSRAEYARALARRLGLPDAAPLLDLPYASSTYDEGLKLQALAAQMGWRSLIVVTDPFHTRRAGQTMRVLLRDVRVEVDAAPNPRFDAAHWWETEEGLEGVSNEYLKLGFYWLKYGIAPF